MGLTRKIWTIMQVIKDEPDSEERRRHHETLRSLLDEVWRESPVRRGVMKRKALRDATEEAVGRGSQSSCSRRWARVRLERMHAESANGLKFRVAYGS